MTQPRPEEHAFTDPIFRLITVVVADDAGDDAQTVAEESLRQALPAISRSDSSGWTVRPVSTYTPRELDLIPPDGETLSVAEAWELTHALRKLPAIDDAEPSFEHFQDDADSVRSAQPPTDALERGIAEASLEAARPDNEPAWSPRLIKAHEAWQVPPRPPQNGFPAGKSRGEGIRIGHPDSGYRRHHELTAEGTNGLLPRLLTDRERDYVDEPPTVDNPDGNHGLGTASVIMSLDNEPVGAHFVTGVAPAAELVPLRVAKTTLGIPSPVLFRSGADRLRDAIYYAMSGEAQCHVISISLGWLKNRSLHRAVQEAVRQNIIVCAAAGNYVRLVVWPARYPEVIGVAGCNVHRKRWSGSCRGPSVDISAPAENVWRAYINESDQPRVGISDGTSYAVASVAGVAALWLAHWGRAYLLDRYEKVGTLTDAFRTVLARAADPFAEPVGRDFGAGIVNARMVLETPLPAPAQMAAGSRSLVAESAIISAPVGGGVEAITEPFDDVPEAAVRAQISSVLAVPQAELDERLATVGDELAFHLLTHPRLRQALLSETTPVPMAVVDPLERAVEPMQAGSPILSSVELSPTLRARIQLETPN
jgi:hypothetical protein